MRPSVALHFAPPSEGDTPPWQRAWARALEASLPEGARLAGPRPPLVAAAEGPPAGPGASPPAAPPAADPPAADPPPATPSPATPSPGAPPPAAPGGATRAAPAASDKAAQAVALYERARSLPAGHERRALGRRALGELHQGDARVFVALATRMALATGRGLEGAGVRARLALALAMPPAWGLATPELALCLVRHPELFRRFVCDALEGSLPERCAAARLLERAALAAGRAPGGAEAFGAGPLGALARLLDDPEPLVWAPAASARGLLAPTIATLADELARGLDPAAGSRTWPRALTSLVASLASGPAGAMRALRHAVSRGAVPLEPAALAGAVFALGAVAEGRPELAAEALARLLAPGPGRPDGALAAAVARLSEPLRAVACSHGVAPRREGAAERALRAYLDEGAGAAHRLGLAVASLARDALEARPSLEFASLRARVAPLLDDGSLGALLALASGDAEAAPAALLEGAYDRLADAALAADEPPPAAGLPTRVARRWQLRALVHVADAPAPIAERGRERRARVARAALGRLVAQGPSSRAWAAALARAAGLLAAEGAWDELDLALLVAGAGLGAGEVAMISEASTRPGARALLGAWAAGAREVDPGPAARLAAELGRRPLPRARAAGLAFDALARATAALAAAPSLEASAEGGGAGGPGPLAALAAAGAARDRTLSEARARAGLGERARGPAAPLLGLHALLERALRAGDRSEFDPASAAAADAFAASLPGPLGEAAVAALRRLARLPAYARPSRTPRSRASGTLPPWMPPNRTVGGFFLERALGRGGSGTVFVARRSDDRHDPRAPRFALKVPGGGRAEAPRAALVERLMRDEAVALLGLPEHPNLARLVTVDLSTRPGPVVVTELVDGVSVEQIVAERRLDVPAALAALAGLLAALAAMHEIGVGHLDVKPSNVIVRPDGSPVLVDFGLAGRALRPGCVSGPYAAPEAWGAATEGEAAGPPAADVYAFACFAFEIMTGRPLFEADTNVALLAAHLTHDGSPPRLAALARDPALRPFAALLSRALRRAPNARPSARDLAAELARLAPALAPLAWPLAPREPSALGEPPT